MRKPAFGVCENKCADPADTKKVPLAEMSSLLAIFCGSFVSGLIGNDEDRFFMTPPPEAHLLLE